MKRIKMFNRVFSRQRTRFLAAVLIEEHRLEFMRFRRVKKCWNKEEHKTVPVSTDRDALQELENFTIFPKDREQTELLVFLSHGLCRTHDEVYPASLGNRLDKALQFDWAENLMQGTEHTLFFHGDGVTVENVVKVPIFSMESGLKDRLNTILQAEQFKEVTLVPLALSLSSMHGPWAKEEHSREGYLARRTGEHSVAVYRYFRGSVVESFVLHKDGLDGFCSYIALQAKWKNSPPPVYLVTDRQEEKERDRAWLEARDIPGNILVLEEPLLAAVMRNLMDSGEVRGFERSIRLVPRRIPKSVWPLAAGMALYLIFGLSLTLWENHLKNTSLVREKRMQQLEAEWAPVQKRQRELSMLEQSRALTETYQKQAVNVLDLLEYLTRITPDDTWLREVRLKGRELTIWGESGSAMQYQSILAGKPAFSEVSFASSVKNDPRSNKDRFSLKMEILPGPLGEATSLAAGGGKHGDLP